MPPDTTPSKSSSNTASPSAGRVLVAGATGTLGREVVRLLHARGRAFRALTRDRSRLPAELEPDQVHVGDAMSPSTLEGAFVGVQTVFSCLGASVAPTHAHGRAGFTAVDTAVNLALLEAAKRAGVRRFTYVSTCHRAAMSELAYVKAHELVVAALETSGLEWAVVRPTGFFAALAALLPMARRGRLPLFGGGTSRSNPIHEADLAEVCLEAIDGREQEIEAGGPDVLSRSEMNALAFEALGLPAKQVKVPLWTLKALSAGARPLNPRMGQLMAFVAALSEQDVIARVRGRRRLSDYFAALARA